jgi:hypothetical protein
MPEQPTNKFNLKAYLPLLATAYGEAADQDFDTKVEVLSTMLNRAESGRAEFGADTGKLTDVLQRGYYAYSKQSPKFTEAMSQKFPDKPSEDSFKEVVAAFSGLMSGKVKRTDSLFFLTPKEVARAKKTKSMNMDLLERTGQNDTWIFYKYAATKPKGRKLAK